MRAARSLMHAPSIACLLPNSAYRSRFETLARVAISSVLAPEKPRLRNTPKAALSTRSRSDGSARPGPAWSVASTGFLPFIRSSPLRWYQIVPNMARIGTLGYHCCRDRKGSKSDDAHAGDLDVARCPPAAPESRDGHCRPSCRQGGCPMTLVLLQV